MTILKFIVNFCMLFIVLRIVAIILININDTLHIIKVKMREKKRQVHDQIRKEQEC